MHNDDEILAWKESFRIWLAADSPNRTRVLQDMFGISDIIVRQWSSNARRKYKSKDGLMKPGSWYFPAADRKARIDSLMSVE